ncbi:unnamed protein product [Gordionus sp. m RMFG-2023]
MKTYFLLIVLSWSIVFTIQENCLSSIISKIAIPDKEKFVLCQIIFRYQVLDIPILGRLSSEDLQDNVNSFMDNSFYGSPRMKKNVKYRVWLRNDDEFSKKTNYPFLRFGR